MNTNHLFFYTNYFWSIFLKGMDKILVARFMATCYRSEAVLNCSSKNTISSTAVVIRATTWLSLQFTLISKDPPVFVFIIAFVDSNRGYDATYESIRLLTDVIAILADWEKDVPVQRQKNQYSHSANYQVCPFQIYIWGSGKWLHSKSIHIVNSQWNEARPSFHVLIGSHMLLLIDATMMLQVPGYHC